MVDRTLKSSYYYYCYLLLSLSPPPLSLSYFAEFVCCEILDSNSFFSFFFLKMNFSLPQLFVFLFDVLSIAVFAIRDRSVKKPTCP